MAMFVHLAPAKTVAHIKRAGIKATRSRRSNEKLGVFCMPVTPNYVMSHQWGRELRRRGERNFSAVYFRIPDDEPVQAGFYGQAKPSMTAAEAVKLLAECANAAGMEIIISRKIMPKEIHRITSVNPITGWRYYPTSHGRKLCLCRGCLGGGGYGDARLKRARVQALYRIIRRNEAPEAVAAAMEESRDFSSYMKLGDYAFLADHDDHRVQAAFVSLLEAFRGEAKNKLLMKLARSSRYDNVRIEAALSLMNGSRSSRERLRDAFADDAAIMRELDALPEDWFADEDDEGDEG